MNEHVLLQLLKMLQIRGDMLHGPGGGGAAEERGRGGKGRG